MNIKRQRTPIERPTPRVAGLPVMNRRGLAFGFLLMALWFLIFPVFLARADFEPGRWTRLREVLIPDRQAPAEYVLIELDGPVYQGAQSDLGDLRVVDDQNREVASKVLVQHDETREAERAATIINQAQADGRSFVTLDLGAEPPRHNRLRLETASRNFSRRVTVEASDDNRGWERVRDDGYIFDFSRDAEARYLTLDYPLSTRRYLRVTVINKAEEPVRIDGAAVIYFAEQAAQLGSVPAKLLLQEQSKRERTSVLLLDLGFTKLPTSRLEFAPASTNFHRHASIEGSNSAEALSKERDELWQVVGGGEIFDIQIDQTHARRLQLDYSEAQYRYLRVKIFNYDDQPIAIREVRVQGSARQLLFRREPGRSYNLFYGNAQAAAPHYDLEQLASYLKPSGLKSVKLGAEIVRAAAAQAAALPAQHSPAWLWAVMAVAVAVLGTLIYRLANLSVKPKVEGE